MWHSSLAPQAATDNEIHCISEPATRVLHQGIMWVVYMSVLGWLVKATSKPQERVQTGVTGWYTQSWTNTHLIDRNTLRIPANFYNLYFIFHSLYAPLTEVRRDCRTILAWKREGSRGHAHDRQRPFTISTAAWSAHVCSDSTSQVCNVYRVLQTGPNSSTHTTPLHMLLACSPRAFASLSATLTTSVYGCPLYCTLLNSLYQSVASPSGNQELEMKQNKNVV